MTLKKSETESELKALKTYTQLIRAADTVTWRMHGHLSGYGLTISQFGVLEALYHKGPLCQRDIGIKILKSRGNITTVIDNLEKRNLVAREKNPEDRRYMTVVLTPEGSDLIASIFPIHAKIALEVFSVLQDSEVRQLGKLLKKLGKANIKDKNRHALKK